MSSRDPTRSLSSSSCKRIRPSLGRYVRSWTEQEDAYLILQRRNKIPYRQIAMRLHKTELACRLHHHQITSHRQAEARPEPRSFTVDLSPLPEDFSSDYSAPHAGPSRSKYKVLAQGIDPLGGRRSSDLIPLQHSRYPASHADFAIDLPSYGHSDGENVDLFRLQLIYSSYRQSFWSEIAREYSGLHPVSPATLEAAFFEAQIKHSRPKAHDTERSAFEQPAMAALDCRELQAPTTNTGSRDNGAPIQCPRPNRCAVSAILNRQEPESLMMTTSPEVSGA